jgi:gliding motility-associated-like protein
LKRVSAILLFLFSCTLLKAAHIVGADFYYRCLGNNEYEITLKVYKDCFASGPNVADFDQPAIMGIFDQNNLLNSSPSVDLLTRTNIPPLPSNPCYQAPANVCVEEGVYRFNVTLPANSGTYTITYQRCCRNYTIVNLLDPVGTGATYSLQINTNAPTTCNSSPVFTLFPPIVICAGQPLVFDHSATDPDGDRLEYSFYNPFNSINQSGFGLDQNNPGPATPSEPPYAPIVWQNGFSTNYPVASAPALAIDLNTGQITGTPNQIGQYVVGVVVKEYRNNVLIGETRRDFQFNVTQCLTGVDARIPTLNVNDPLAAGTDGVYAYQCSDYNITFRNTSLFGTNYSWDFGVPNRTDDTSNVFQPTFTYPDTGIYYIRLIVNPGFVCADTSVVMVRIYPQFNIDFSFTEKCEPVAIPFTDLSTSTFNDVNSWNWSFGDGQTATQQNPQHTYTSEGNYNVRLIATTAKGCIDTITKQVTVHPQPSADYDNTPTCINTPVDFFHTSTIPFDTITSWQWKANGVTVSTDSAFTDSYNALQTFSLTLIVTTNFGCVDSVTKNFTVYPLPVITHTQDLETCFNDTLNFFATGGVIYDWFSTTGDSIFNQQNPTVISDTNKTFTVVVTDANECRSSGTFDIVVFPLPETNAGADDYVCIGNTYQLNGTGGVSFSWQPDNVLNNANIASPVATITDTTTFILTSLSIQGCKNYDTVTINVQFPVTATITNDTFMCQKDTVQIAATGGLYYVWTPAAGLSSDTAASPYASPDATTLYSVKIANDCFDTTLNVNITVYTLPTVNAGEDDTIFRTETTTLTGIGNGVEFYWSPPFWLSDSASRTPTASPINTTNYILTMVDGNNCKARDTVQIFVIVRNLIVIPNAFTPNRDGHNDVFRIIRHLNVRALVGFKIFNRWGQLVFETNDIEAGWDGTFKGEPQPMEVYQYFVKALNWDGEYILEKGNVTLVR